MLHLQNPQLFAFLPGREQEDMVLFGKDYGIMKTNCLERGELTTHSVLCLETSRFNHSCLPNVEHRFVEPYMRAYAVKDIKEGDEMCISYALKKGTISEIQKELQTNWRFQCKCLLCDMKDVKMQKEIEAYRLKYWNQWEKIAKPVDGSQSSFLQRLEEIDMIFEFIEKGRLRSPSFITRSCFDGFQMASACKNLYKKQRYINLAYKFNLIAEGKDSPWTKQLFELMK